MCMYKIISEAAKLLSNILNDEMSGINSMKIAPVQPKYEKKNV